MHSSQPAPNGDGTDEVLILGAGPAGLATALFAARRGMRVSVIERGAAVGGLTRSETIDGVRVDLGSHRLHPAAPAPVLKTLTELLGDDLQLRPRNGRVRIAERWVGFPLRPAELARRMPMRWLLAAVREAVHNPERGVAGSSYEAALRSSLGPTAYESIYGPFARKLWGLPGDQIDAEQARVRVTADSAIKVAARMVRRAQFFYPRKGYGQICEELTAAAERAGAQICLDSEVVEIVPGDPVTVRSRDGRCWQAARVLSTLPIPVLARTVTPSPPDLVVAQARGLRMRAMLLVYLTHRPALGTVAVPVRWTPYDAHYLPSLRSPVSRISEPANYRDSADDPVDRSVVCAEIPCTVGDDLWSSPDEALAAAVTDTLSAHNLPSIAVDGVQVRRVPAVYPVYDHGFAQRLQCLENWAEQLTGVTTFGRAGLFAHDNTHHALVMAQAAAVCLGPGGAFDEAAWGRARESFRGHVVED